MKSYSDKISTTEEVEERLGDRIDKVEKKVFTYSLISAVSVAINVGLAVVFYLKYIG